VCEFSTTSEGDKLKVKNHALGSRYFLDQNPKNLNLDDDIASGCTYPNCWILNGQVYDCPEDDQTPHNVQTFNVNVYIPARTSTISFNFSAAPEDGCTSPIKVSKDGIDIISCDIAPTTNDCSTSGTPYHSTITTWRTCTATANQAQLQAAGVDFDSYNWLTVSHNLIGSYFIGNYECESADLDDREDFMHFDNMELTCTYT